VSSSRVVDANGKPTAAITPARRRRTTRILAQDLARARQSKLGLELVEERPGGLHYKCGNGYFTLFQSAGGASGPIRKWAGKPLTSRRVRELRQRGVTFEEYDLPGLKTVNSVACIEGNYPSKAGAAEKGAWFRDNEGNLLAIGQTVS